MTIVNPLVPIFFHSGISNLHLWCIWAARVRAFLLLLFVSGAKVSAAVNNGWAQFEIKSILDHVVVVISRDDQETRKQKRLTLLSTLSYEHKVHYFFFLAAFFVAFLATFFVAFFAIAIFV